MNQYGQPPQWNQAHVLFQCAPWNAPGAMMRRSMTILVYGDTETAVFRELQKRFPRHCNLTILDLWWTPGRDR